MASGVIKHLEKYGIIPENIQEIETTNSNEFPYTANMAALTGKFEGIICVGIIVKEDNNNFDSQAQSISQGILNVQLNTKVPVINGVVNFFEHETSRRISLKR